MHNEVEAKFQITGEQVVNIPHAIWDAGGEWLGVRCEVNEFYDTKNAKLNKAGVMLRIRTIIDPLQYIITCKGKQIKGSIKNRKETEFIVSDIDAVKSSFKMLGFTKQFSFEKQRITFKLDSCLIEIDTLPKLGYFCEIEGPNNKIIKAVKNKIGCKDVKLISKGYGTLIKEFFKDKKVKALRF